MFFIPYGTTEKTAKKRLPWVTGLLVLINVAVFALQAYILINFGEAALESFIRQFAFIPASLQDGGVLPGLLTAMFLHAGLLHIIGNMLFLMPFGDNVEDRLGHVRYIVLYLVCGVIASLAFALFHGGSTTPLIGASGAIGGILGAYLALHPRGSKVKGLFILIIIVFRVTLPASLFIGYWFVMQVFSSISSLDPETAAGQGGGVAFIAHVGGFVAGLVLAPLLAIRDDTEPEAFAPRHLRD